MKRHADERGAIETADAVDGVIYIAFEQAANVDHIRRQTGEKSFANAFSRFAPRVIDRFAFPHRPGRVPHTDIFLREQTVEGRADGFDGVREKTAQGENDFMLAAVTRD